MSIAAQNRWKNSKKMRTALTEGRRGSRNPSYGSRWMYNPTTKETSKIQKENIQNHLDKGWLFGRSYRKSPTND